ncbi:hypothetical protein AA15669_1745 [Saccharibacter floricola DSM 15669]|uniref:Uncharacterized protein n=1 Tax=Saccharibacter floricola DSM 15669 TaxID=1123227 RepID=A0ABQ0P159_9PROT|nr:hypothetical protein AA15669_1745 [Saccharibacter floricola DSM 15669]
MVAHEAPSPRTQNQYREHAAEAEPLNKSISNRCAAASENIGGLCSGCGIKRRIVRIKAQQ